MSDRLDAAFSFTMRWEGLDGEITDHPDDPGGRTRWGVTERDYPELWEDGPPSRTDARTLYRDVYYRHKRVLAHKVDDPTVAAYLADTAFNQGQPTAARVLQRACVLLGHDISVDGWVGSETLEAANSIDPGRLLHAMIYYRSAHHVGLAEDDEDFRSFVYGWLRRDYDILNGLNPRGRP